MKKIIVGLIIALLIIGVIAGGIYYWNHRDIPSDTTGIVTARLENASECTTQKLIYNGAVKNESGKIPIIDKSTFLMTYTAVVRAGFDMSDVKVYVKDKTIRIIIPKAEIQEITIDPSSLEFYDTSFSILHTEDKKAVKQALKDAKEDAKEKAGLSELLKAADEHAETLIRSLIADLGDDYEIVISHK